MAGDAGEDRRRGPRGSEFLYGEGGIEASPPILAEMAIVEGADVAVCPGPVPLDGCDDGVNAGKSQQARGDFMAEEKTRRDGGEGEKLPYGLGQHGLRGCIKVHEPETSRLAG